MSLFHFVSQNITTQAEIDENAKRAHCTKSESTRVPTFCTDIRLFKPDYVGKKHFTNIVSFRSYIYDFVLKFEKVRLAEMPQNIE